MSLPSLNIKNPEVYQLASDLARVTGKSMTAVVLDALRQQMAAYEQREQHEAKVAELMAIGERCAVHINKPVSSLDHGDFLYDENGLPK